MFVSKFVLFSALFSYVLAQNPITVLFSQREVTSPCTGSQIFFDFGQLTGTFNRIGLQLVGELALNSSLRHEDLLWEHDGDGKFSILMNTTNSLSITGYETKIEFPNEKVSFIYSVYLTMTEAAVIGMNILDIEVAKC